MVATVTTLKCQSDKLESTMAGDFFPPVYLKISIECALPLQATKGLLAIFWPQY